MQPYAAGVLLVGLWGTFIYSARKRWKLMTVGGNDLPVDRLGDRFKKMFKFAIGQARMPRHKWAGIAHMFIYVGAMVMLLRGLIMFARGFVASQDFGFVIFDQDAPLGKLYSLIKDGFVVLVLVGIAVFLYYRAIGRLKRMTLNFEGYLILAILTTLMLTDVLYDGATAALRGHGSLFEPLGSYLASFFKHSDASTLHTLQHIGYWGHVGVILLFLNYLPYCKQFHEITSFPNVFFSRLTPVGRLPKTEDLEGRLEREEPLGVSRIDHFGAKAMLDFFTCTECGRCTDQCPANGTGKLLSPKHLTVDLRDFAYNNQTALIAPKNGNGAATQAADNGGDDSGSHAPALKDLIPDVIKPEVLWACTTCGACETECPVFITYVDKIVDMRRHLVQEKAEFPAELQNMFRGLETNSNPWSFPASDRAAWAEGLGVPTMAEKPDADVLFWVGCSASFDDRARRIARAMANLLKMAGINFAILGEEEQCTGDCARRAGNEFLFQMLADMNVETLNNYNPRTVVTTCPHCFNTLLNEYPDFGAKLDVVHHSVYLSKLIKQGKLQPKNKINARVAYHDSCYMGRYNNVYEEPRDTLKSIRGLTVLEPTQTRDRGMCCGAGGAQMFKEEEEGTERVNIRRTEQLLETKPDVVASSCPFCQRMLIDGLSAKDRGEVNQLDIAELLWQACEPAARPQTETGA
ncbi:MAG: (Fe-S)-binding protein [Phycisphaerales bacterium]|nr:(Fe-S)-binding protein [Phycisphaerales bacterium]MCB9856280.1 (Fe-S)-binding protein [Phycisphaerales bacterium]MCB9863281.1 (Fe-S)-binding protein [Phycisphaerales bacterium]